MRRRLLAITVAATALVVVAFVVPLAGLVRSVAHDRAVSGAERDMASLAPALAAGADPTTVASAVTLTSTGADGRLAVWLPDGTRVGDDAPADDAALTLARQRSFSVETDGGLDLYTPVVTGDGTSVVRARLPDALLTQGVARSWTALALVGVALVAAAGLIADRLGRSLTREATALAATARTLASGDPDARVIPGATPELGDAARALNLLADRIDELRSAERARVADLSHRLRTPLTALRLDVEATGDPDLGADLDRLEAAVTDVIREAQRPLHDRSVRARADLVAVVRDRAAFWAALADDDGRGRSLVVEATGAVPVGASEGELAAALDAVLGNVFQHTPEGTAYRVSLVVRPGGPGGSGSGSSGAEAEVRVDDAGPGIADPEAALARGRTSDSRRSTGLG
ncbi:MAG TPA: HAMP domain-containing sensor histidine kinase, partial [Acidimicrobiales bacterium]